MNVGPYNIILEGFNLGIVCVLVNKLQPMREVYEFSFREMICLQYFHKIFTTNFKWQVVIVGTKK